MTRSLADLKAKPKQLPTRTVRICLDQEPVAAIQRLDNERDDLELERSRLVVVKRGEDGERTGPPPRIGEGPPPRVAEIDARLAEIAAEMEAHNDRMLEETGDLLLRNVDGGEWQRFKDDNPPREGNKSDEYNGYGLVDSAQLRASLGRWVEAWEGENFPAGAWDEWFVARVSSADQMDICKTVMQMQEQKLLPKARSTASSETPSSEPASS